VRHAERVAVGKFYRFPPDRHRILAVASRLSAPKNQKVGAPPPPLPPEAGVAVLLPELPDDEAPKEDELELLLELVSRQYIR